MGRKSLTTTALLALVWPGSAASLVRAPHVAFMPLVPHRFGAIRQHAFRPTAAGQTEGSRADRQTEGLVCAHAQRGGGGGSAKRKRSSARGGRGGGRGAPSAFRETYPERIARLGEHAGVVLAELGRDVCWREQSNDANAIVEVFGVGALGKTPAYACEALPFSPAGHTVLEVGGHIGAFALYALRQGAAAVVAYEPHPENADLYRANTRGLPVDLHQVALVAHSRSDTAGASTATAALVIGKDYQGVKNTWRHALAPYSHYKGAVETVEVQTRSFDEALTDDITFVKMDCEGAELDILPAVQSWRNVERLVFEYSFTKRRDMPAFWDTLATLREHGFHRFAFKDFTGEVDASAWRHKHPSLWQGSTDALVFCLREPAP